MGRCLFTLHRHINASSFRGYRWWLKVCWRNRSGAVMHQLLFSSANDSAGTSPSKQKANSEWHLWGECVMTSFLLCITFLKWARTIFMLRICIVEESGSLWWFELVCMPGRSRDRWCWSTALGTGSIIQLILNHSTFLSRIHLKQWGIWKLNSSVCSWSVMFTIIWFVSSSQLLTSTSVLLLYINSKWLFLSANIYFFAFVCFERILGFSENMFIISECDEH